MRILIADDIIISSEAQARLLPQFTMRYQLRKFVNSEFYVYVHYVCIFVHCI